MEQVKLGGYPAKKCARRTHNEHAPGELEPVPVSPDLQALFEAGRAFEAQVVDEFRRRYRGSRRLLVLDDSAGCGTNQRRTVEAMNAGAEVIVGGRLPDVNGRAGAPDVLIRHLDGYLPVDIKNHKTLKPGKRSEVELSTLTEPDQRMLYPGYSNRGSSRWPDDTMQLSHYTRMLQELGFHPGGGPNIGGIFGTSDLTPLLDGDRGVVWYDLDAQTIETYSTTGPGHRRKRSPLQRYDHEFAFRIAVAEAARSGAELVRPYRIGECDTCEWFAYCTEVAGPDDASFAIEMGHLNVREWQYLYQHCGSGDELSVAQLAGVDAAAHADGFRVQSVGTQTAGDRLKNVIKRAQMTADGEDLAPRGPLPVRVPQADIEVDFDIEWDLDERIYLWGLRIRDGQDDTTARYQPIVSFDSLDEDAEIALADEFAARIQGLRACAEREGKSIQIFHWHNPETRRTRKFAAAAEALDGFTFDLCKWFKSGYFARTSSSIKAIAPIFGFRWAVEDPGGLTSQYKIDVARGTGPEAEEARRWCLAYNQSDVAAQAAIRDGLRTLNAEADVAR